VIVKSIKIAGIEVEFRELKDAVERQDGEIRALQFVVAHFLPDAELRVLSRFAEAETYTLASDDHEFFNATGPLRGLGFIEPIPENWTEDFNTDKDLKTLFRLTDRGREYLELRMKSESFTP
jgi:hypothetical protein